MAQPNRVASWAKAGLLRGLAATAFGMHPQHEPSAWRLGPDLIKMRHMPPVIRASGGRCDITRRAPRWCAAPEARRGGDIHAGCRAREGVSGRRARRRSPERCRTRACCRRGPWRTKPEFADSLGPLVSHRLPAAHWRALLDREIERSWPPVSSPSPRPHRRQRGGHCPHRHLPRSEGQPAALRRRPHQRAPDRQGARPRARAAQAAGRAADP